MLNLAAGGEYEVVFALPGFRTFEATKQEVRLGLDSQVNATVVGQAPAPSSRLRVIRIRTLSAHAP